MARDRKAIEARKRRERQEAGEISKRNEYGFMDSTAYQAIKNIMHEEQKKQAAHKPNGM